MLVLNRKINESIILDDGIEIKILEIVDGKVKIGIEAPKEVTILRKEVYEEISKANNEAANMSKDIFSQLMENRG